MRNSLPAVFIRDDDVWELSSAFCDMFRFLIALKIPVVYGVIPSKLQKDCASFLKQEMRRYPGLIDIAQHGLKHVNHSRSRKKYEFGANRTYKEQLLDIQEGRGILRDHFGRRLLSAFIPPYHGFDHNTIRVLDELGIAIFSAGERAKAGGFFLDVPTQVLLNQYGLDGRPVFLKAGLTIGNLISRLVPGQLTGVLMHHDVIRHKRDLREVKIFFRALTRLRDENKVRLVLLSEIQHLQTGQ